MPAPATPFTLVEPAVEPGQVSAARYPAATGEGVPARVFHGARPGPVIAILLHGFASEEAFHEAAEQTFGAIPRAQLQGTVLTLHLPARTQCDGAGPCAPAKESSWRQLTPHILNDARFVVDVHQDAAGVTGEPFAFVYLPHEDQRLATYVKAMASACMIPNVVELREAELDAFRLSADALQHIAPQSLALSHPAISIETSTLVGDAGAPLRKGLANLLDHLKMATGGVSWQNRVKQFSLSELPPGFFGSKH